MLKKSILALAAVTALWTGTACAEEYYMRPGDELNIVVTQQQDLGNSSTNQSPFVVRPDGNVSFPLVGEIHAEGMTVSQFTDVLQQGLARYIVDPDVSVNISKLGRVRVYVFGEVRKPGAVELEKGHTVTPSVPPRALRGIRRRRKFSSSIRTSRSRSFPLTSITCSKLAICRRTSPFAKGTSFT